MRNTHTFILKVLLDHSTGFIADTPSNGSGQAINASLLRGQISEPASDDEWRASFTDVNELLQHLVKRVSAAPGELEIELALRRVETVAASGNGEI